MDSTLNRFKDKFIEETNGLLDRLEKDLLELEKKPSDKELIESAFRATHTIKGTSNMFGFDFVGEFTHTIESLYQLIREGKLVFNCEIFEITFQSVDHIRKLMSDEKLLDSSNQQNHHKILDSINKIIALNPEKLNVQNQTNKKSEIKEIELSAWHVLLKTSESIFFRGINLVNIFNELSNLGEFEISRVDDLSSDKNDVWSIILHSKASEKEIQEVFLFIEDDCTIVRLSGQSKNAEIMDPDFKDQGISIMDYIDNPGIIKRDNSGFNKESDLIPEKTTNTRISVDAEKLDQLMFLVSELITVNSQLNISTRSNQFDFIKPYLEKLDTLSKYFRNNALEIRLVPLNDSILRFERLVRDLSKNLNKKINFITQGTNTELDKSIIDQLSEPLIHIIRNCIDHGIESPEIRLQKGKQESGNITLAAYNSGNNIFITVTDDGSGINLQKVKQKAIDKGIIKPSDKPTEKELLNFIFLPGFSTAENVTEVSGRGVGMDVVKKRINDLRGEVFIDSEPDAGTTFTLKLQQSMSIIDSLLFSVDDCFFTVPVSEIAICEQLSSTTVFDENQTSTLPFNNHLIPFIDLRRLFNLQGNYDQQLKSIIIRNNDKELAVLCDKIIGGHQAVLKPLGKSFRDQKFITAASQMGDGKMAFMIDTNALFKLHSI